MDILFTALTRPSMIWGVPSDAVVVNLLGGMLLFILSKSLVVLLPIPVVHMVFYAIARRNPRFFRILILASQTKGRSVSSRYWGAATAAPLAARKK